jgi:hypothetical protein
MNIAESLMEHESVDAVKAEVQAEAEKLGQDMMRVYGFPDGSHLDIKARPGEEPRVEAFGSPHEVLSQ